MCWFPNGLQFPIGGAGRAAGSPSTAARDDDRRLYIASRSGSYHGSRRMFRSRRPSTRASTLAPPACQADEKFLPELFHRCSAARKTSSQNLLLLKIRAPSQLVSARGVLSWEHDVAFGSHDALRRGRYPPREPREASWKDEERRQDETRPRHAQAPLRRLPGSPVCPREQDPGRRGPRGSPLPRHLHEQHLS